MLSELADLENTYGEDRVREIIRAVHYLLQRQFVFAGDHGTGRVYNTLTDARFTAFIKSWFDAAGYALRSHESEQWVGIIPNADEISLPRMTVDQTIVLLVLAFLWQEEINAGNVEDRATVLTTVNTIYDRYEDIVARRRKTEIPPKRFLEVLEAFERRNIIDLFPEDLNEQDREIIIRPQIRVLAGDDVLARIERFLHDEEVRAGARQNDERAMSHGDAATSREGGGVS